MVKWSKILGLALLSGGSLMTVPAPELHAATSATADILSSDGPGGAADSVDLGSLEPIARPDREAGSPPPSGNPLWSVPLSVLTATQERPIFSASRRPPPRAVIGPRIEPANVPIVEKPTEHPSLALIGAVVGDSD